MRKLLIRFGLRTVKDQKEIEDKKISNSQLNPVDYSLLKSKFVIEDGNLVLSKVRFHRDMVKVPKNVTGGGSFTYDLSDMSFTFWGASADFGAASLDSIREAVLQGRVYSNNSCRRSIAHRHDFYFGGYFEHNKDKTLIQKR